MGSKHGELLSPTSAGESILTKCFSERKWKMKLKEWNFEKYVPANEMNFVVAKLLKRQADEGRDTVFFRGETQITTDRIENFKKRKTVKDSDALIADAGM